MTGFTGVARSPIAIVGLACRFPGADGPAAYWELIRKGRVATGPVSPRRPLRSAAAACGIDTGAGTAPVIPVQAGGSAEALRLSERMRQRGINVQPIVAPAVPDESARLFVNATHSAEQIDRAVEALRWSFAA